MFVSEVEASSALTPLQIEDRLASSFGAENRLLRQRLADVVALDRCEAYRVDSARSMVDWLCYRFDLAERTAREYLRVGHALEFLPALADAFEEGDISWDKLCAVTSYATPVEDAGLAHELPFMSTAQVQFVARHRRRLGRQHAACRRRARELHTRWDEDEGMLHIWGHIPDADGALVRKTIDALSSDSPRHAHGGFVEPHARRSADALVRLCAGDNGTDATVVVHADVRVLSADEGAATVEGGIAIAPETLRRLTCDGPIRAAATKADKTIALGRTRRVVPPSLHDELVNRDRGCRWDGCNATRWLYAHHVKHWAHGGTTDAENLVMLCGYHHREVHEGGADIRLDDNGHVTCIRRDGRPLARAP